jgi:hypothetical protein
MAPHSPLHAPRPASRAWWKCDRNRAVASIIICGIIGPLDPPSLTNRFSRQRAGVLPRFQTTKILQPAASRALARRG